MIDRCCSFFDFEKRNKTLERRDIRTIRLEIGDGRRTDRKSLDIDQASRDILVFLQQLSRSSTFSSNLGCLVLSSTCETKSVSKPCVWLEKLCGKSRRDRLFPFCSSRFVPPMLTRAPPSAYATDNDLCLATSIGRDSAVLSG